MLVLYLPLFKFLIKLLIVSKHLSDPVRSHKDPYKDASPFLGRSFGFTRNLQSRWSTRIMSWTFLLLPSTRYNT
ncbi:hypothetical protein Hanom_Chr08g00704311 [Helianthus anomalus]